MQVPTIPGNQDPDPLAPQWDQALARVLDGLRTDRFPAALRQLIGQGCAFDSMVVTRYAGAAPPVCLYQDLDDVQAAITVQFYATGPYLLDPLYQACRNGAEPGAYRLFDLVSEGFFRSEYFRTFYRKIRISDEIGILIREADGNWIIVSLARMARRPRFAAGDVDRVNAMFRTVSAAIGAQWGEVRAEPQPRDEMLEDRLAGFGADVLSPREAEIVRLVLQGHSTPSAAAFLGITEGTVKVHRHNAYAKLGIASQAELFHLATRHLSGG